MSQVLIKFISQNKRATQTPRPSDGGVRITRCCACRAEDEAQTRDPQLGRLMLYQLSYFRKNIPYQSHPFPRAVFRRHPGPSNSNRHSVFLVGSDGFEPPKAYASRFTVCPIWPLWYLPLLFSREELARPFSFLPGIDFAPLHLRFAPLVFPFRGGFRPAAARRPRVGFPSRWRDSNPRPADYKSAALAN